jgi:hypothetical protein
MHTKCPINGGYMRNKKVFTAVLLIALFVSACTVPTTEMPDEGEGIPVTGGDVQADSAAAAPPEEVLEVAELPAAAAPEITISAPDDIPASFRTLKDSDSSLRASEKRVLSGDNFNNNLFERPFTSEEMVYQPDLDILTVDFAEDELFFYFTIRMHDVHPEAGVLTGFYGVEFDRTLTGRGDLLVFTDDPGPNWSSQKVTIYIDENVDVGGPQPLIPDTGHDSSGYDGVRIMQGGEAAFSRQDPNDPKAVQFAISRSLLGDPKQFLWGGWADNGLKDPAAFDYNDILQFSEAGSPFRDNSEYPVKDLFNVDNTCRLPYGFPQGGGNIPGMCINTPPPSQNKPGDPGSSCPYWEWCYPVGDQIICVCVEPPR